MYDLWALIIFIMFILGAFKPVYALNYNEQLYDLGANLNTLFNSWGCSYFLKGFPCARVGQGEGIAYLGAGMLIMLIVSIPIMVYRAARLCFNIHHTCFRPNHII